MENDDSGQKQSSQSSGDKVDLTLCFLSAVEQIKRFRAGTLSPVQVLRAQMANIDQEDHLYNVVTAKHYEEALEQAIESEKRYKEGNPRPLEGITIAIKDETKVKGWRTTYGSLMCKDVPVELEDSVVAAHLRSLGAVFHIQTNVPEFSADA